MNFLNKVAELQAAVAILNAVYEVDFRGFSYGFRAGCGPHDALDALAAGLSQRRVNWVLDSAIRSFFDQMSHEWTMRFIQHRIADERILRLIQKWLRAGVSEDGKWSETKVGTPQGAVISPQLANVYLHYLFDVWMDAWRKKEAKGEVIAVRNADDLVMGFQRQDDAERFLKEFQERLAKFGLEVHPDKTRLIEFGTYARSNRRNRGEGEPEKFTFLGFTHSCGTNKDGHFVLWRRLARNRLEAKLLEIKQTLRRRINEPVTTVCKWLGRVLNGFYQYHGVPGNWASLSLFRRRIRWLWWRTLERRSQTGRQGVGRRTRRFRRRLTVRFAAKHSR